jgi:hypothetical protein
MSQKAGKYVSEASAKTVEVVSQGTQNFKASQAGTTAGGTMSSIGKQAAEGGTYLYNMTRSTTQGIVDHFAGSAVAAACSREAKCDPQPALSVLHALKPCPLLRA